MLKVVTIVFFLILGAALLLGLGFPRIGGTNYVAHGGFLPNGWTGVALGVAMAVVSFLGVEIGGGHSGEAQGPSQALPKAVGWTLARLGRFYCGGLVRGVCVHRSFSS